VPRPSAAASASAAAADGTTLRAPGPFLRLLLFRRAAESDFDDVAVPRFCTRPLWRIGVTTAVNVVVVAVFYLVRDYQTKTKDPVDGIREIEGYHRQGMTVIYVPPDSRRRKRNEKRKELS